jgi:phosphoserine phosphatase RsbU/P
MSTSAQCAIEAELKLAARVQLSLLPKPNCCLAGWDVAFSYEPARHVSGDYVDLVEAGPDAFHFILGDVSGKGVAASLLMAHLHATVRVLLASRLTLDEVVRETSRMFCQNSLPAQFVTLVLGKATKLGEVQLVNAGHTPVLFRHAGSIEELPATEVPVGLFCGNEPSPVSTTSELRASSGELLLLYSDGVTETTGVGGFEYGADRLQTLLLRSPGSDPGEAINAVLGDLRTFSGGAALADDRSLLALRFGGVANK